MGLPWRDHHSWSVVERAESALGEPLAHLLLAESADELARTRESQLSVLLTSLVVWDALKDQLGTPVAFAGHSLGQVTALIAGGVLSLEDGLQLAALRAEATQAAADAHPRRMAALMGADEAQAQAACAAAPEECWVANDNAPGQVVVAGTPDGVELALKAAAELGIRRSIPLKVGGAFHTPLMADAAEALALAVTDVKFSDPSAPVVSNADAQPYSDGGGWAARLPEHLISPVRWRASTGTMTSVLGATGFVEVGFGTMLATLAKRCTPGVPVRGVATPGDVVADPNNQ
jgi:[acyl-carrier-protein] S-malonyltransferase